MEYGSHTDEILLEPNSEFKFSSKSDDTYLVDIELETTDPTSGIKATKSNLDIKKKNVFSAFSAVMLGNGDYAIGFRNVSDKSFYSSKRLFDQVKRDRQLIRQCF